MLINLWLPINLILEKKSFNIYNLYNSSHELHKTIVKYCFYNKGSTLTENIQYLMFEYVDRKLADLTVHLLPPSPKLARVDLFFSYYIGV